MHKIPQEKDKYGKTNELKSLVMHSFALERGDQCFNPSFIKQKLLQ